MKNTDNKTKYAGKMDGVVVSDKMKDTVVVKVKRFVKHPKYDKYTSIDKRYKAHDAGNSKKVGDKVTIVETAPISKDKRHRVI
jgi:small subunit ribosomal protein S17